MREAIRVHGEKLERVLVEKDGGPQIEAVARFAQGRGAAVELVSRGDLDRASKGARHQGAIAYAPDLALVPLEAIIAELGPTTLVVALDELEDPQNFGAVIRSCVALGASAILWPEHHAAPLSPATFRASAGAVEHATLCRVSALPNALERLRDAGATIIGLDANAEHSLPKVAFEGPVVLVVGAEGKGLRKPVKRACTELANLPMTGVLDSLNASVAAAIAIYEVLRRRNPA
ncbi:23S rRNA (guanosine-2'-O-) -methyltransferase rlmB [Labilithrix luteola]|uniref:23S rRNA (Guanosine-2'-O-)-methyltransferase rlmB n=1 Tax=Labilithrix luteola TaxID=1391654 RepID=A0A0K1Q7U4_9BACT|nr:23S rRNA (guanosine-2'-O-) -methyltransferase rlmB [Labilithrix luteola]